MMNKTYCIVLKGWSLLPNALLPFQIYCAAPNLGITRTWIFRLNFAQRPIFSGLRFFNEPEISDSGPPAWSPSRRNVLRIFTSWKMHLPHPDLNPRTLDLEASTLPWDHRSLKALRLSSIRECLSLRHNLWFCGSRTKSRASEFPNSMS